MILLGLSVILLAVLVLPFFSRKIEANLEAFLFVMGVLAALASQQMSWHLGFEALYEPIPITLAVFIFSLLFKWSRPFLDRTIKKLLTWLPIPLFIFLLIFSLGLLSSLITAIIASLLLVEVISILRLDKKQETNIVILACFAIGLGAALTPIGEPLATIAIAKLKIWPEVNFWYLAKLLGIEIIGGIVALACLALIFHRTKPQEGLAARQEEREEPYSEIFLRTGKVYIFVMALVFLGEGFKPVIDRYIIPLSADLLYWINTLSAVLDNATLTAAEISSAMQPDQIKKILMGLLIAGGMLIPGNIPNIIAASKLKITMKEWAKLGIPLGLALMLIYFLAEKL